MKSTIQFSWKGLLLAPLAIPFVYSLAFTIANPGRMPAVGFMFFFILGCIFSYSTTIFLFLPCLHFVAKLARTTIVMAGVLGAVVSVVAYLPLAWEMYLTSGIDSGPPQGPFSADLWRQLRDPAFWAFPVGGLVTAMLYWFFANRQARRGDRPTE